MTSTGDDNTTAKSPADNPDHKPDIVDAEAHGTEPPQSNEGRASGRNEQYRNTEDHTSDNEASESDA